MKAPRPNPHRRPATLLRLAFLGVAAAFLLPAAPLHGAEASATNSIPNPAATTTATNSGPSSLATNAPASPDSTADRVDRSDRPDRGDRDRSDRRSRRSGSGGSDRRRGDRPESSTTNSADSGTNSVAALPPSDFAAFKIITDRNIFNPNRGRGSGRGDREAARKPVQIDLITLVGALSYAKGDFAFFDGSSAQFRKVLKCGDSIAGFTIRSIAPSVVQVENAGKTNDLKIGSQLRREDEGEWQFIARSDAAALTGTSSGSGSGGGTGSAASTSVSASGGSDSGGAANDILERLRKKREQENK